MLKKAYIFYLFCPCCAGFRSRIRILFLTCCFLNIVAWLKCGVTFYDILLLNLSLQVMGKNKI